LQKSPVAIITQKLPQKSIGKNTNKISKVGQENDDLAN
jgi:hypothetical protein